MLRNASFARASVLARAYATGAPNVTSEVKNGIGILRLDLQDAKMNVLSEAFSRDFAEQLSKMKLDNSVRAVVIISAKPDNFIAGADINMLSACKTAQELEGLSIGGQRSFAELESMKKPVVAAINGTCLGGGLELALACHYRIATESSKTQLGLPEIKLGLIPGAGGTQRLTRLIGLQNALPLMLTGNPVRPSAAKRMKLVDQVADPYALESAAIQAAEALANGTLKPSRGPKGYLEKAIKFGLEKMPFGRNYVFGKAKEQVVKTTGGKYPAPFALMDAVKAGLEGGMSRGLALEAKKFGELGMTPESRALISIFHAQNATKRPRFGKPDHKVQTLGVIGAGLMGAGITEVSITKGYRVALKDNAANGLARGLQQIRKNLDTKVKRKRMSAFDAGRTMSNIIPLTANDNWRQHFKNVDLVVEAVFEDMKIKHKVIQELEEVLPEHAIIATNTSALPIGEIATASKRPGRVIGMHYFSPVDKMPLLEIITHAGTDKAVAAAAVEVGTRQGKTCIVVKDVPGFYVNRSLGPYMSEVFALLQDGVQPETLDKAMKSFGFPVGPISLADEVGIDVACHVQEYLTKHLGTRMAGSDIGGIQSMVKANILGRKTNAGFFLYPKEEKGKKAAKGPKQLNPAATAIINQYKRADRQVSMEDIQWRCVSRFVNEAIYCLQDGIIASPSDGDIGAIFGIGFPPFLGGPFRLVDAIGAKAFADRMLRYSEQLGPQFKPAELLLEHAKNGTTFHQTK